MKMFKWMPLLAILGLGMAAPLFGENGGDSVPVLEETVLLADDDDDEASDKSSKKKKKAKKDKRARNAM